MASTKRKVFNYGQWFQEKQELSLKGMAYTSGNGFHKKNDFHWNYWLPIKGIASDKRNVFHYKEQFTLNRFSTTE